MMNTKIDEYKHEECLKPLLATSFPFIDFLQAAGLKALVEKEQRKKQNICKFILLQFFVEAASILMHKYSDKMSATKRRGLLKQFYFVHTKQKLNTI